MEGNDPHGLSNTEAQCRLAADGPNSLPQAQQRLLTLLWRTVREQCLDFVGTTSSLHDVRVRLLAFIEEYHRRPHAGLIGDQPGRVLATGAARPVTEEEIRAALTISERRRVRGDSTVSIGGKLFQVTERFLGGRVVAARRGFRR